jgi:hypothetical protein
MSDIKFATFPFTHKGINFVSRISEKSRFLPQIMLMGDAFIQLNMQAIDELINLEEATSMEEIESIVAHINEGGTEMFLELAGN